jgi:hypothetical protein
VDRRTAAQELALRGHVLFHPGTVTLDRDAETLERDLVERIRVTGPDPIEAAPTGPGTIQHREETAVWGWCHHYTYSQSFQADTRPLEVRATFSFCFKNGVADPEELVFDADRPGEDPKGLVDRSQLSIMGLLDNGTDYLTEQQFYRSCTYPDLPRFRITVELPGDDRVVLYKRYLKPFMGSGPVALVSADVALDGEQRVVEDYFKMAYGADLHNFNERYLLVFDSPVGEVYAIHFEETNENDPPAVVDLLDAGLDLEHPLQRRTVESYLDEEVEE